MSNNLPFLKLQCWPIKFAVWRYKKENGKGYWFSGTLTKTYKDKNGEYQDSDRLNGDDFLKAAALLQEAHAQLVINEIEIKRKKPDEDDESEFPF